MKLNKHARMRARQRVRGESYAQVASDYGVSPSGLWHALQLTEKEREQRGETRGRKTVFTEAQAKQVRAWVVSQRRQNKEVTYALMKRRFNLDCSNMTLKRHVMKPLGMRYGLRARKPAYCAATRERREAFGKKMIKDGGNTKTIKKIHVSADNFDVRIPIPSRVDQLAKTWKRPDEAFKPENTAPPRANKAPPVHMLPIVATKGGRGGKGKLLACPIYDRMTIDTACHLFSKVLIPALKRHYRGQKKFVLCIDKCSCMNNKDRVRPLLKKAGIEIAFRGQNKLNPVAPGQLSDWFPIENCNAWAKRAIVKAVNNSKKWRHGVRVTKANVKAFARFCQRQYKKIPADHITACFGTWGERTVKMVKNKGGATKY